MQWHYTKDSEQFGPVAEEELRSLVQQEKITKEDLVWNHTMGDKWVPASSIESIFPSAPPPVTDSHIVKVTKPNIPQYNIGSTHNRDLMQMAKESLRGNWGLGVLTIFLYQVVTSGTSFIPILGYIAILIIAGPMVVGFNLIFLTIARRTRADIEQLFQGFSIFGTALGAYLLTLLYTTLWTLLLIIPGIIAAYSYSMTFFIIADDPTVGANEAITRSKEMMVGNKWKLFCLYWRFFGWSLLCIFTLGIGYLWLVPYMQTTLAHFYEDVKSNNTLS